MEEQSHNSARDPERDPEQDVAHNSANGSVLCRVCGAENRSNRLFCANCGTYLKGEEEDTWVDLPGVPPAGRPASGAGSPAAGPTWPSTGVPSQPVSTYASPAPLAWDDPFPQDHTPRASEDYGLRSPRPSDPSPPSRPPRRRHHWALATLLVVLLIAAAGVTGAVAYKALLGPESGPGDGGSTGGTSTTSTGGGAGSTTTSDGPDTTTGTSTTSTAPAGDLGEPVDVVSTFASSTLPAEAENDYRDGNVVDGRLSTCWAEGVDGDGTGEWVRLDLGEPTKLATIEIANGYQKDERRFGGNPRVETLRVEYSDGSSQVVRLHDDTGFQIITTPPTPTEWVKLVVESTYPGDTWEDTSISEVRLYRTR